MPVGVPDDAICVNYTAENHKTGDYYIWHRYVGHGVNTECRYYWYALGNNGEEDTGFEATQAARAWIKDGLASRTKSNNKL